MHKNTVRLKEEGGRARHPTSAPFATGDIPALPEDIGTRASDSSIRSMVDRLAPSWQAAQNTAAASELASILEGSAARLRVMRCNPIPPIVALLALHNESVLEPCCACLYRLAQDDAARRVINAAGILRDSRYL